jgi:hypothetical protein
VVHRHDEWVKALPLEAKRHEADNGRAWFDWR